MLLFHMAFGPFSYRIESGWVLTKLWSNSVSFPFVNLFPNWWSQCCLYAQDSSNRQLLMACACFKSKNAFSLISIFKINKKSTVFYSSLWVMNMFNLWFGYIQFLYKYNYIESFDLFMNFCRHCCIGYLEIIILCIQILRSQKLQGWFPS